MFCQGRIHTGVVLLRLAGLTTTAKVETVAEVSRLHGAELAGAFCVISPGAASHSTGDKAGMRRRRDQQASPET